MATKAPAKTETVTPENTDAVQNDAAAPVQNDVSETSETETETKTAQQQFDEFQTHFNAAFAIAAVSLPLVLTQHREGSNPEHAKQIKNLQQVVDDGTAEGPMLEMILAKIAEMQPKIDWMQSEVELMNDVYKAGKLDEAQREMVAAIDKEVLHRSPVSSGKGKAAGTGVTRIPGVLHPKVAYTCLLCDQFKSDGKRIDAATAPKHLADNVRTHMLEGKNADGTAHGVKLSTQQVMETAKMLILGQKDRATFRNEGGDPVFQIAAVGGAPAEDATPDEEEAAAEAALDQFAAEVAATPETV